MANNISPEERLFNIIRHKKTPADGQAAAKKPQNGPGGAARHFMDLFNPAKWSFAHLSKTAVAGIPARFHEADLKTINRNLTIVVAVLAVAVVAYGIFAQPTVEGITREISQIDFRPVKKRTIEKVKPVAFYLEGMEKRDIFALEQKKEEIVLPKQVALDDLKKMMADYKLKGIVMGLEPKAILKDEKKDKIYFLQEGQALGTTGIEIKKIIKDKVSVTYQGEEMELP